MMSVPMESITVVSMHPVPTLWAATTVLAMLAILVMGLTAVSLFIYSTNHNIHSTQCMYKTCR